MSAPITADAANSQPVASFNPGKLTGLAIVSLLPALFWTALLAYAAHLIGADLSTSALAATATAIALFLTTIFTALATGSDGE